VSLIELKSKETTLDIDRFSLISMARVAQPRDEKQKKKRKKERKKERWIR
jgi:hypothetical protein